MLALQIYENGMYPIESSGCQNYLDNSSDLNGSPGAAKIQFQSSTFLVHFKIKNFFEGGLSV